MPDRTNFDEIWSRYGRREGVSAGLEPFARDLFVALVANPVDVTTVKAKSTRLLEFLASPPGRSDVNCRSVTNLLLLGEFDWSGLPEALVEVLADMAGTLHDTVSSPEIAANFDSTPELLLARLRSQG